MADVEVRAAHNVIEACAQTETIEKAVFTSSVTAVIWRDDRKSIPSDLDERHWTDINFSRKFKVKINKNPLISEFYPMFSKLDNRKSYDLRIELMIIGLTGKNTDFTSK